MKAPFFKLVCTAAGRKPLDKLMISENRTKMHDDVGYHYLRLIEDVTIKKKNPHKKKKE